MTTLLASEATRRRVRIVSERPLVSTERRSALFNYSRTALAVTGILLAAFVHLAQLTIGSANSAFVVGDAYHNLVGALEYRAVSIPYIVAAIAVGAHLLLAIWAGMRSLGLIRPGTEALARAVSVVIPPLLIIGMSTVPVAVLLRVLT